MSKGRLTSKVLFKARWLHSKHIFLVLLLSFTNVSNRQVHGIIFSLIYSFWSSGQRFCFFGNCFVGHIASTFFSRSTKIFQRNCQRFFRQWTRRIFNIVPSLWLCSNTESQSGSLTLWLRFIMNSNRRQQPFAWRTETKALSVNLKPCSLSSAPLQFPAINETGGHEFISSKGHKVNSAFSVPKGFSFHWQHKVKAEFPKGKVKAVLREWGRSQSDKTLFSVFYACRWHWTTSISLAWTACFRFKEQQTSSKLCLEFNDNFSECSVLRHFVLYWYDACKNNFDIQIWQLMASGFVSFIARRQVVLVQFPLRTKLRPCGVNEWNKIGKLVRKCFHRHGLHCFISFSWCKTFDLTTFLPRSMLVIICFANRPRYQLSTHLAGHWSSGAIKSSQSWKIFFQSNGPRMIRGLVWSLDQYKRIRRNSCRLKISVPARSFTSWFPCGPYLDKADVALL